MNTKPKTKYLISADTRSIGDGKIECRFVEFSTEILDREKEFNDRKFNLLDPMLPEAQTLASILSDKAPPRFVLGEFKLNSGRKSSFKIDCERFTQDELAAHAFLASRFLPRPRRARAFVSVPKGGDRLADFLNRTITHDKNAPIYIVDDVLTTGGSMQRMREEVIAKYPDAPIRGLVLYARGPVPDWINAVFTLDAALWLA